MTSTRRGREIQEKFDNDPQANAGIDQSELMGFHGMRDDDEIYNRHTTTFIIVRTPKKQYKFLGLKRTNKDITPTIIKHLLNKNEANKVLKTMDGHPLN